MRMIRCSGIGVELNQNVNNIRQQSLLATLLGLFATVLDENGKCELRHVFSSPKVREKTIHCGKTAIDGKLTLTLI